MPVSQAFLDLHTAYRAKRLAYEQFLAARQEGLGQHVTLAIDPVDSQSPLDVKLAQAARQEILSTAKELADILHDRLKQAVADAKADLDRQYAAELEAD